MQYLHAVSPRSTQIVEISTPEIPTAAPVAGAPTKRRHLRPKTLNHIWTYTALRHRSSNSVVGQGSLHMPSLSLPPSLDRSLARSLFLCLLSQTLSLSLCVCRSPPLTLPKSIWICVIPLRRRIYTSFHKHVCTLTACCRHSVSRACMHGCAHMHA